MKLSDYIEAANRYQRGVLLIMLPVVLTSIVSMAYLPFLKRVTIAAARFGEVASSLIAVAPVAFLIGGALTLMIPLGRRYDLQYGIPCEHCGKPLAKGRSIVIASKHCPHCGQRVISDG